MQNSGQKQHLYSARFLLRCNPTSPIVLPTHRQYGELAGLCSADVRGPPLLRARSGDRELTRTIRAFAAQRYMLVRYQLAAVS